MLPICSFSGCFFVNGKPAGRLELNNKFSEAKSRKEGNLGVMVWPWKEYDFTNTEMEEALQQ
ncbi:hypothetical protein FRX31_011523, partial [Thalictrum thalictroides]